MLQERSVGMESVVQPRLSVGRKRRKLAVWRHTSCKFHQFMIYIKKHFFLYIYIYIYSFYRVNATCEGASKGGTLILSCRIHQCI